MDVVPVLLEKLHDEVPVDQSGIEILSHCIDVTFLPVFKKKIVKIDGPAHATFQGPVSGHVTAPGNVRA